ncbi:MAG: FHA domain-containing protein [Lachnospiraceae bacterium]|nr:FHA domain-containing protein [Lachnospiraceae bacterium]
MLQFDTDENCDYVAKLLTHLNASDQISLSEFKNFINILSNETGVAPAKAVARKEASSARSSGTGVIVGVPPVPQPQAASRTQASAAASSREVPPSKTAPAAAQNAASQTAIPSDPGEKPISLFYVLMHYSKDNMAKYKAQKNDPAFQKQPKEKKVKEKKKGNMKKNSTELYDIPGVDRVDTISVVPNEMAEPAPGSAKATVSSTSASGTVSAPAVKTYETSQAKQPAASASSANFGETTVLGAFNAGETTVLSGGYGTATKACVLIRRKTRERVVINKPSFRIGKERSCVDLFIGDNAAISRSHATINQKQGDFYLADTNSTNHTYLNGRMLISSDEVKLASGDVISFADDEFDVEITG